MPPSKEDDNERLTRLCRKLSEADRAMLLAFAEFLANRADSSGAMGPRGPEVPKEHPRPEQESVVAAIRRLSDSYYMLERDTLLHETAALMNAHVLQGRPAPAVIDDLEALFAARYARYRDGFQD